MAVTSGMLKQGVLAVEPQAKLNKDTYLGTLGRGMIQR